MALVVGADTTPKGFFAPVGGGDRKDDPDWLRFHLMGATNPTYFALYARRRMDRFGATEEDFAQVKVKNARHGLANPYARYRGEVTVEEVLASPMVADPLRLLEICATSDGGAALVLTQHGVRPPARRRGRAARHHQRRLDGDAVVPQHGDRNAQLLDRLGRGLRRRRGIGQGFRPSITAAAYAEAGIGPEDIDLAEVYDLSAALELDWYEDIGLCGEGEAEKLLRDGVPRWVAGCRSTLRVGCPASVRPSRPRPSPRSASASGSSGARPPGTRSKGPGWPSRPTRACSATAPRSCSPAEFTLNEYSGLGTLGFGVCDLATSKFAPPVLSVWQPEACWRSSRCAERSHWL